SFPKEGNMKKHLLLAAALTLFAGAAFADTYTTKVRRTADNLNIDSGGTLTAASGSTVSLSPTNSLGATLHFTPTLFTPALTGNPLMQGSYTDVTVGTGLNSATMATIIASTAGKAIYPTGALTIMVSGTAATATALALECSDGRLIASWPIADLVDLK